MCIILRYTDLTDSTDKTDQTEASNLLPEVAMLLLSLGNDDVFHMVLPIWAGTGIMLQPYVIRHELQDGFMTFRSSHSFAGTVTK